MKAEIKAIEKQIEFPAEFLGKRGVKTGDQTKKLIVLMDSIKVGKFIVLELKDWNFKTLKLFRNTFYRLNYEYFPKRVYKSKISSDKVLVYRVK